MQTYSKFFSKNTSLIVFFWVVFTHMCIPKRQKYSNLQGLPRALLHITFANTNIILVIIIIYYYIPLLYDHIGHFVSCFHQVCKILVYSIFFSQFDPLMIGREKRHKFCLDWVMVKWSEMITANLIIIDVRYPLSTVFSTSLLLENRWNHDNGRQLSWEWQ
jgi:hypothetical protein